ncbi:MAG: sigma-70 family RNA polymerase sigma factor, partial [Bacteroidota bacterium]
SQDVFLTAWKSLSGFRGDAKFSVWLYRITYNAGINRLRKKKLPVVDLENRDLPEHADLDHNGPLQQLHQAQRQQVIEQAMQQLAPIDRSLLQLFYLEELSIKEIVPILQLTESNAKVRLLRARKRLHHSLQQLLREETAHLL